MKKQILAAAVLAIAVSACSKKHHDKAVAPAAPGQTQTEAAKVKPVLDIKSDLESAPLFSKCENLDIKGNGALKTNSTRKQIDFTAPNTITVSVLTYDVPRCKGEPSDAKREMNTYAIGNVSENSMLIQLLPIVSSMSSGAPASVETGSPAQWSISREGGNFTLVRDFGVDPIVKEDFTH